jgi:hypothetical protein
LALRIVQWDVKELSRITRAKKIPADWAAPEQRAKAALKAVKK